MCLHVSFRINLWQRKRGSRAAPSTSVCHFLRACSSAGLVDAVEQLFTCSLKFACRARELAEWTMFVRPAVVKHGEA